MKTKINKTIMNFQIKSFEFYKMRSHRLSRDVVHGFVYLEGKKKIHVVGSSYLLLNAEGVIEGEVLKSNPGYKRIKRMIARKFQTYRRGGKSFFREKISGLRSRITDALHDCNLFRISEISFKENRSNFLKLAS